MSIFRKEAPKVPAANILHLPKDYLHEAQKSVFATERDAALYPLVTQTSSAEVETFMNAGLVGPLQAKAESVTKSKKEAVYSELIEVTPLPDKPMGQVVEELESLREDNPFMKAYVSAAVLEALKQSDNVTARRMAQRRLDNVLIAAEILNDKTSQNAAGFWNGVGDFLDTAASDLPIVSSFNVERRKELSDRFVQLLDSAEEPAIIQKEMEAIITEAEDMGFFTDQNRFYLSDLISLTSEEGRGDELSTQRALGGLDILLSAGGAVSALRDAGKLIALTRGSAKEAGKVLVKGAIKDDLAGAVDPATWSPSMYTPERLEIRSATEAGATIEAELDLQASKIAAEIRVAAGSSIDDETFSVFKETVLADLHKKAEATGSKRVVDIRIDKDPLDNIYLYEYYGTSKGKSFTDTKAGRIAADKYAAQVGGEVVKGSDGGLVIRKTTNLPTQDLLKPGYSIDDVVDSLGLYTSLNGDELGNGFFAHMGSPLSQTDVTNNAVLKQGEAATALAVSKYVPIFESAIRAAGKDGTAAVEKVLIELRDGSLSHLRQAPTVASFGEYFFKINGRNPTQAETALYRHTLEWNDVDWLLKADIQFKREVAKGTEMLTIQDGMTLPAVRVTNVEAGRLVWDADAGKYVDASLLPADRKLYRLHTPTEFDGKLTDLVASAIPNTRALKHTDVMGYNVGGSRIYYENKSNFVVKQTTEYTLADGTVRPGVPRALMYTKTEKEAVKATDELNTSLTAIHSVVNPKAFPTAHAYSAALKSQLKNSSLDEVIARNSGWNTSVHTLEGLLEFADETGFDLRKPVQKVGDGDPLVPGDSIVGDLTFKDVATSPGKLKFGDIRKDNVLRGYGGQKVPVKGPIETITNGLLNSTARQNNLVYETRAGMRLFKTAAKEGLLTADNIRAMQHMSVRQKLKNMKISTGTSLGKKLELERKKILSRVERQRWVDDFYHRQKDNFSNYLHDLGFKGAAAKLDKFSVDPNTAIRGIVFDRFFWGAIDQVYVQGSQVFNISAMAKGAKGVTATGLAPFVRGALANGHMPVMEELSKKLGTFVGVSPEHMMDIILTFKQSGKAAVQASTSDLGSGTAMKFLRRTREAGRIFFTEGELMGRISAHITASLEYIEKNGPKANLRSQHATRWVMHESDKLTMAMTSASRHPIEQLPMMQFMTYPLRVTEYLLAGMLPGQKSVLSYTQKSKLATMQLGLFGVGAVPFAGAYMAYYEYKYGTGMDEETYDLVRKGMLDSIIYWVTGVETELGKRLSWGEGIWSIWTDLQEKSVWEIGTGVAGTTAVDIWQATNQLIGNIKYGSSSMAAEDLIDVAKLMKFSNMAFNAFFAFRDGYYRMKNSGDDLLTDVSTGEAMAIALGVPLERVNKIWSDINNTQIDNEYYKELGKNISNKFNDLSHEVAKNGWGTKYAQDLMDAIAHMYAINPDVDKYDRYVDKSSISMYEQTLINEAIREAGKELSKDNN